MPCFASCARSAESLTQARETLARSGRQVHAQACDLAQADAVHGWVDAAAKALGGIDILVNNAGIIAGGRRLAETSTKDFDAVMNVNLRGTFFCCRAGFTQMKQQGGGTIINMSSVAGVQAWAGTGTYSASKHGIMALTKTLADEGRAHNIKVTAICPGGVADELVDASPEEILRSGKIDPFDIAEAAVYLATLGRHTVVHQIVIDRLGADW